MALIDFWYYEQFWTVHLRRIVLLFALVLCGCARQELVWWTPGMTPEAVTYITPFSLEHYNNVRAANDRFVYYDTIRGISAKPPEAFVFENSQGGKNVSTESHRLSVGPDGARLEPLGEAAPLTSEPARFFAGIQESLAGSARYQMAVLASDRTLSFVMTASYSYREDCIARILSRDPDCTSDEQKRGYRWASNRKVVRDQVEFGQLIQPEAAPGYQFTIEPRHSNVYAIPHESSGNVDFSLPAWVFTLSSREGAIAIRRLNWKDAR